VHWPESELWRRREARREAIRDVHARAGATSTERERLARNLVLEPTTRPTHPPASGGGDGGGGAARADGEGGGRWALGEARYRTPASLRESLAMLARVRALLRAWEERLCCGLMAVGSVRVLHRLWLRRQAKRSD
jgi:hypothetical protein